MNNDVVINGVKYVKEEASQESYKEKYLKYKELWDMLRSELQQEIAVTRSCYDDFKEQELSVNMIEMEGALRELLTLKSRIEEWEADWDVNE